MKFNYKRLIKLVGIIIFVILLIKIDIKKAVQLLVNVNLAFLILAMLLTFVIFLIRTLRWKWILEVQGHSYRFMQLFRTNLGGSYFASVTPGGVGEFIKIYYLKQYKKIPSVLAVSSIMFDRFMNIPFLLIIAVVGTAFFPVQQEIQFILIAFFLSILLGVVVLGLSKKVSAKLCKQLLRIGFLKKRKAKLKNYFKQFYYGVHCMLSWDAIKPISISVLGLGVVFLQAYAIVLALSINISFLHLCAAASISTVVALIPVSVAGIGTRDIILVVLFTSIGITAESAISFSFLFLLTNYVFIALIGAYAWFKHPLDYEAIKRKERKLKLK